MPPPSDPPPLETQALAAFGNSPSLNRRRRQPLTRVPTSLAQPLTHLHPPLAQPLTRLPPPISSITLFPMVSHLNLGPFEI